ncbi:hypothetical protein Bca52824_016112 [Brassica carinata]|uniref:Uncharacterized protein n=1 Tax=Brassica carinata TaxID=52824 RepID=A0A8X8B3S6_BRACI|nr:hypothetical protein Bca52824_016112 [Brassica carinata]
MSRSPSHHHHHHKIRLLLELKQSRDLRRSLGDRDQNLRMESLISEASCEGSRDSAAHRVLLKVDSDKNLQLALD